MSLPDEKVLAVIRGFIAREKGSGFEFVSWDTELLESGLVDSFALIELGEEIARELNFPLFTGNLVPEDFETPRILWERILEIRDPS